MCPRHKSTLATTPGLKLRWTKDCSVPDWHKNSTTNKVCLCPCGGGNGGRRNMDDKWSCKRRNNCMLFYLCTWILWDALLESYWSAPPYCSPALSSIFLHPVTPSDTRKRPRHSADSPVIPGQAEAAMLPSCPHLPFHSVAKSVEEMFSIVTCQPHCHILGHYLLKHLFCLTLSSSSGAHAIQIIAWMLLSLGTALGTLVVCFPPLFPFSLCVSVQMVFNLPVFKFSGPFLRPASLLRTRLECFTADSMFLFVAFLFDLYFVCLCRIPHLFMQVAHFFPLHLFTN